MDENNEQSLATPAKRPGWEFRIPGALLKIDSKRWTPEQRKAGILIRCVYPLPSDERRSLGEALAEGNGGAVVFLQVRNSLSEVDGAGIPFLEREMVWDAIGHNGRQLAIEFFQLASTPDKEAMDAARASFRVSV